MEGYCPVCFKIVAPFDPEVRMHQGQRTHGHCLKELEKRFPSVMAAEHPERESLIFRRVQPAKGGK